jgi:hypothetical protein
MKAPLCRKCKVNVCQHYGKVGGYSVQCRPCNEKQEEKRREVYQRRKAKGGA